MPLSTGTPSTYMPADTEWEWMSAYRPRMEGALAPETPFSYTMKLGVKAATSEILSILKSSMFFVLKTVVLAETSCTSSSILLAVTVIDSSSVTSCACTGKETSRAKNKAAGIIVALKSCI